MNRSALPRRRALTVAALSLLAACGSGGGTVITGNGSITIAVSPISASIVQGGAGTIGVTVTGSGGFTGTPTLTVTGLPTGVTYTVSNVSTVGAVTTATVNVAVGAAVTAGNYTATVTASATGVTSVTTSYGLTVASATSSGFVLSAAPTTIGVAQGGTSVVAINIARTGGFAGSVSFTATGMSSGLSASFSPSSTTANTSTLTLTATSGATTGVITLTIHGAATGLADQTTTVQVTVSATVGGTTATFDFSGCAAITKPIWFASQDGNGAWTRVAGSADVYSFAVASSKGGYAYVTQNGAAYTTTVRMMTQAEFSGTTVMCPGSSVTTKTVGVTVVGTSASGYANLALGGGTTYTLTDGLAQIPGVQSGVQDFFGYRTPVVGGPAPTDRALLIRDLNVANGGSAGTADFTSLNAITPISATINVAGTAAGDAITATMGYLTGTSCSYGAMYTTPSGAASALTLYGIPASAQRSSDFHSLAIFARNGTTITRDASLSFHSFAAQTITLGAVPAPPTVTNLNLAGYKRLQAVGVVSTDYSTSTAFYYTQRGTATTAYVSGSQSWLAGTAYSLVFPDFSAAAGWNNAWAPAAGVTADWTLISNYVNYVGLSCVEGAKIIAGRVTGSN